MWNFSKVTDEGSKSRYWHKFGYKLYFFWHSSGGYRKYTYIYPMPHNWQTKLSAKLRAQAKLMYNCLGQRGQIKLFSDSVCAARFWGNSNPNTENSFKFIFFIFDLLPYSIYQCKYGRLLCHITKVWGFCTACCALLPRSIQAEACLCSSLALDLSM